jgi:hypothetical protein
MTEFEELPDGRLLVALDVGDEREESEDCSELDGFHDR